MGSVCVGRAEEFPENTCRIVPLPTGDPVLVINLDGEFHVLAGRCTAGGHSLENCTVVESEGKVLCPMHGWEIDLDRGLCSAEPDHTLKIYKVSVEEGEIRICTC